MTAHIEAKKEDIAKIVIMPGDPLRAKFIAENYLEDYKLINNVRGMLGFTGTYKGKRVTIMASGMGMPSMGIYSYELYKFYDVETIIRVGSCGAFTDELKLYDLILASSSYSNSSYAKMQNWSKESELFASEILNTKIKEAAQKNKLHITEGKIYSSDVFYSEAFDFRKLYEKKNVIAIEMESFALFHNAKVLGKKAACLLTVSDNLVTKEETTSEERQVAFKDMMLVALESIL